MKLISSRQFLKHKKEYHVERPERIKAVLKDHDYEKAKDGSAYLNMVHDPDYIEKVKRLSKESDDHTHYLDAGETYVTKDTYKVACYAAGAAVQAAKSVLAKKNAFALVRPPGHHAHPGWTGGFCVFNNIAIGSAYLVSKGKKVLIIDIDIHRGDGTQDCVKQLNKDFPGKLFYLSFNQEGVFPGASLDEGNIRNIYIDKATKEKDYIKTLTEEVKERIKRFKPTAIAVSAGFDFFRQDKENYGMSLGCELEFSDKVIKAFKGLLGKIPYFVVLEGGYDPDSVKEGVDAFLKGKKAKKKTKTKKGKKKKDKKNKKKGKKKKRTKGKSKKKAKKKTKKGKSKKSSGKKRKKGTTKKKTGEKKGKSTSKSKKEKKIKKKKK